MTIIGTARNICVASGAFLYQRNRRVAVLPYMYGI
jgi:hypothetical protein